MTGRPVGGVSDWDGPEWAAPERAERLASTPRARRGAADFPLRAYVHGFIEGHHYQEMRQLEAASARANRARAVQRTGEST